MTMQLLLNAVASFGHCHSRLISQN